MLLNVLHLIVLQMNVKRYIFSGSGRHLTPGKFLVLESYSSIFPVHRLGTTNTLGGPREE